MTGGTTEQTAVWLGEFGRSYTDRNTFLSVDDFNQFYVKRYGQTRDDINRDWLRDVPFDARILEIGCNVGQQLSCLQAIGYQHLYGIEIQRHCVEKAKTLTSGIDIIEGSAFDIPFGDGFFDLVFTNNVLIHFSPQDLPAVFDEAHRVTRRYIWGFEYFAPEITAIRYRGHEDLLWKADYARIVIEQCPDLRVLREKIYKCRDEPGLQDKAFLLEKTL